MLRTARTPLRRLWALAYRGMARMATAYLTWGERDAARYLRGSVCTPDFLPGLSDIDTAIVLAPDPAGPGIADERVRTRLRRLFRAMPLAELLVEGPMVYEAPAFREMAGTSALTYGLDRGAEASAHGAARFGKHPTLDRVQLLQRPGLYEAESADWQLLAGPDRRPPERLRDAQLRRIVAWLELVFWWRWVFPVCIDAGGPRTASLCVKLIAEPVRIWLWLAHGERVSGRGDALRAGLRRLPEEEDALRRGLDLLRSLPDFPDPPLAEVLPPLVRISARIAELVSAEVADQGATEVRLAGSDPAELILPTGSWRPAESLAEGQQPRLLPLADWRGLTWPLPADESFALLPGDPGDPAVLGAAAASQGAGPYPVLRAESLMILPAGPLWRTRLRAIQCPPTDPVSFALAAGRPVASFPNARGWSAEDTARRAVAEHRTRLWAGSGPDGRGDALALLLTAGRAALFLESIRDGDPVMPLTVSETARRLGTRSAASRTVAEEALEGYRDFAKSGTEPAAGTVSAMRELVLGMVSLRQE